jgi:hypothetical protein
VIATKCAAMTQPRYLEHSRDRGARQNAKVERITHAELAQSVRDNGSQRRALREPEKPVKRPILQHGALRACGTWPLGSGPSVILHLVRSNMHAPAPEPRRPRP